jgi:hypothetical protein
MKVSLIHVKNEYMGDHSEFIRIPIDVTGDETLKQVAEKHLLETKSTPILTDYLEIRFMKV